MCGSGVCEGREALRRGGRRLSADFDVGHVEDGVDAGFFEDVADFLLAVDVATGVELFHEAVLGVVRADFAIGDFLDDLGGLSFVDGHGGGGPGGV